MLLKITTTMNIILKEVPSPSSYSYTLFSEPDFNLLKETKTVRVKPTFRTKTRISTSLQFGQFNNTVNFPIDGFKTHNEISHSFLSGDREVKDYFVVSKKQNLEAYKEYVKKVVEKVIKNYFHLEMDEITIELESGRFNR